GDFFAVLGVRPLLGQGIGRADEIPSLPQVAVLSHGLWQEHFGADPKVVGKSVDLDNRLLTIIGVMPAGFEYPQGTGLWTSKAVFSGTASQRRDFNYLSVLGRLQAGTGIQAAQKELAAVSARLALQYPASNANRGAAFEPLASEVAGPVEATLDLMMLAALLVLGIACANVANVLLAGAVGRWREMALRTSLGASRTRLAGQLFAEAALLAGVSGGLGWALASGLVPLIRNWRPPNLPQLALVHLDGRVLLFTVLAALGTAVWFACAPAWELLRPRAGRNLTRNAELEEGKSRLPGWVVVAEVAATAVLLLGASLLWRSLQEIEQISPGFQAHGVLTYRASLLFNSLDEMRAQSVFFQRLNDRLPELPGVQSAGAISSLPFTPADFRIHFFVVGTSAASLPLAAQPQAGLRRVLPGYFRTLQIPVQGREFLDSDGVTAQPVAMLSASLARELFPNGDALQHAVRWGVAKPETYQIVGVAGDLPEKAPGGAVTRDIYMPFLQSPAGDMSFVVRTSGDVFAILPEAQRLMSQLDPQIPAYAVSSLEEVLAATTAADRFRAYLLLAMAALALLLAMAGLYGVLSHSVAQRHREIGIRMALGASPHQVQAMVLRQSLALILSGLGSGLALAWLLRHSLDGLLHERLDALPWITVPLILLIVGLVASYVPARHATRVDPAVTLKQQ